MMVSIPYQYHLISINNFQYIQVSILLQYVQVSIPLTSLTRMKSFQLFYHFPEVFQKLIHRFHVIQVSRISKKKNCKRSLKFIPNDFFKFENCMCIIHIKFSHFSKFLKFSAPHHATQNKFH